MTRGLPVRATTLRATVIAVMAAVLTASCGSGSSSQLAATQTLRFPVFQDPGTWDPGFSDAEVDTELSQNVFDNLWKFSSDKSLTIQPDIATTVPTESNGGISSDGLTYTVHLNPAAKFSNGDPVTSADVLYSWNRAAALQGAYSTNLAAIAGFKAVQSAAGSPPSSSASADQTASFQANIETKLAAHDSSLMMSGLSAPDPETVKITLSNPCGWCLTAWTLEGTTGAIVDEKVIKADPVNWWQKPSEMVGTGPFTLSAYTPKQSIVFKAVSNWWGSPKPTLKEVDITILDPSASASAIASWKQGNYDILGYGGESAIMKVADILAVKNNSQYSGELLTQPKGRTTWVSFNVGYPSTGGPFVGTSAAALGLRKAFALAVDKQGLAQTACGSLLCTAATGGLITKGLIGYGGDNSDPLAKFDPTEAKSLLKQYDPAGTLTANLKYSYTAGGLNDPVAQYLQAQWKSNLGINVTLDPSSDASAFISNRLSGKYVMSRDGWQFDYNHPQDWYDNLWGAQANNAGANTSGYDSSTYDSTLAKADTEPLSQALPLYQQLAKELQDNAVYIPLYYSVGNFLIHSYVQGAGSNNAFDYYWNQISIQAH